MVRPITHPSRRPSQAASSGRLSLNSFLLPPPRFPEAESARGARGKEQDACFLHADVPAVRAKKRAYEERHAAACARFGSCARCGFELCRWEADVAGGRCTAHRCTAGDTARVPCG